MNCMEAVKNNLSKLPVGTVVSSSDILQNLSDRYAVVTIHQSLQRLKNNNLIKSVKKGVFEIVGTFKSDPTVKPLKTVPEKLGLVIVPYSIDLVPGLTTVAQVRACLRHFDKEEQIEVARLCETLAGYEFKATKSALHFLSKRGEIKFTTKGYVQVIEISNKDLKESKYTKETLPTSDFSPFLGRPESFHTFHNPVTFQSQDYDLVEALSKLPYRKQLHLVEMETYLESIDQLNVLLHNKFLTYIGRGKFFLNHIPRPDQLERLRRAAIQQSNMVDEDEN